MISKQLKKFPKRLLTEECGCPEGDHGYFGLMKVLRAVGRFWMFNVYYPVEHFFSKLNERVSRSLSWAKFTYLNYDFDSAYLFEVMEFKLKRIHKCLKNGHAVQKKEDMDALKELIKICYRLRNYDDYEDKYRKEHDKKWGKMPRWTTEPVKDETGKVVSYKMIFKDRPKANSKKKREQEKKDFLLIWEKANEDFRKDVDRMADILKKHARSWWD